MHDGPQPPVRNERYVVQPNTVGAQTRIVAEEIGCNLSDLASRVERLAGYMSDRLSPVIVQSGIEPCRPTKAPINSDWPSLFYSYQSQIERVEEALNIIDSVMDRLQV